MDIYIKPAEKVQLVGKREVLLRDVAEVFLSGQTAGEAERLVVFRIPEERKKTYLLSVVDLIQALNRKYPNATVNICRRRRDATPSGSGRRWRLFLWCCSWEPPQRLCAFIRIHSCR